MKYEKKIARPPADGIGFTWIFLSFGLSMNNLYLKKINSKKITETYESRIVKEISASVI